LTPGALKGIHPGIVGGPPAPFRRWRVWPPAGATPGALKSKFLSAIRM